MISMHMFCILKLLQLKMVGLQRKMILLPLVQEATKVRNTYVFDGREDFYPN